MLPRPALLDAGVHGRRALQGDGPVRTPAAARRAATAGVGSEDHLRELFGERVDPQTLERDMLEITEFERPKEYREHFKPYYRPTIVAHGNAVKNGQEAEFDQTLERFCDEWNVGTGRRRALRAGIPRGGGDAPLRPAT
jgi:hypothetical protein